MASQGAACSAGAVVVGANGVLRAVQPAHGRIHLGTGGKERGQVLDFHPAVLGHPGRGRTDLCVLLLCADKLGIFWRRWLTPEFSGQLFQQSGLLRAECQHRDRQPGPARCRRHQYLYPKIPLLPSGAAWRDSGSRGFQRRSLVDFNRTGLFSGRLLRLPVRRSRCWCSAKF